MRRHAIKARVATIRYTSPGLQRYYAGPRNEQLELELTHADQVWVGDITYLKVGALYRYLAVVMDRYSRRIVGWSFGPRKDVRLTLAALDSAVRSRRPRQALVFHTDRGLEYGATAFRERLAKLGFRQSMNRPGKMTDNAYVESFFPRFITVSASPPMSSCASRCGAMSRFTTRSVFTHHCTTCRLRRSNSRLEQRGVNETGGRFNPACARRPQAARVTQHVRPRMGTAGLRRWVKKL